MIHPIISAIKNRLQEDLPGEPAQRIMAPAHRMNNQFYEEKRPNYRLGSVLILLYEKSNKIHFTLTLRQSYDGVHSGQISLPGGKIEKSDNGPIEAAMREAQEEIGIPIKEIEILGGLSELYIPPSNFLVFPVVGFVTGEPLLYPQKREVAAIYEIQLEQILNEELRQSSVMSVKSHEDKEQTLNVTIPHFLIDGKKIWGATAMILSEFAEIIRPLIHQNN